MHCHWDWQAVAVGSLGCSEHSLALAAGELEVASEPGRGTSTVLVLLQ